MHVVVRDVVRVVAMNGWKTGEKGRMNGTKSLLHILRCLRQRFVKHRSIDLRKSAADMGPREDCISIELQTRNSPPKARSQDGMDVYL